MIKKATKEYENELTIPNRWAREIGTISNDDWKKYNMVLKALK